MTTILKSQRNGKTAYKAVGDSIKAIDDNRFGGYLVRYTSQDDRDLHGEWFSKKTNLWLNEHPIKGKPQMLDHAFDAKFAGIPIGVLDFADDREIGLWIEGKLKEREEYEEMLRGWRDKGYIELDDNSITKSAAGMAKAVKVFFDTGKAQFSSGALPQSVVIDNETGHIDSWAIIESTAVLTPAEPDGTEIKRIKSAFSLLDDILNSVPTATATKEANLESKESDADNASPIDNEETTEGTIMQIKEFATKMEMSEEEMRSFASTVAGIIKEMNDEFRMSEEDIAESVSMDDLPGEDEVAKMSDDEKADDVTERMYKGALAKLQAHQNRIQKAKDKLNQKAEAYKASQPVDDSAFLPGAKKSNSQVDGSRVTVGDNLKYAHLSPTDMAMAWKMAVAADGGKGIRGFQGKQATDYVSEDFYRHAVHKMAAQVENTRFSRPQDALAVKSAAPFKANELSASDITGQGLEYLGTVYDSTVWEEARNQQIYKLMQSRGMIEKQVPQGMKSVEIPLEGVDPTVYGGVEGNSIDATGRPEVVYKIQPQTTSTLTVTPGTFRTATAFTFELEEDSFVDMASEANRKIRLALEENIEKAMINADSDATASTNINNITGTPTSTGLIKDYYLEFDGLRKSPLVTSTAYSRSGGTLAIDDYRRTWSLLGSAQAPRKDNIFFLIDFDTFNASLDLLPTLTKDVAGERASLFTGEFDALWGLPIYMSGFLNKSNSAGKIDTVTPSNNDKGQILAVYAPYWAFTFKRNLNIEMQRSPDSETFEFYGSMRFSLTRRSASAAAISYNLTV